MATVASASPAGRFEMVLEALRRAVAAEAAKRRPLEALFMLIWSRISRIKSRFAHLAARIPPDAPPRPHRTLSRAARRETARCGVPQNPWKNLPRRKGWLHGFVPPSVFPARSQLQALFADEAVQRLIAASPGIRRTLRPLCRMLGLPPPTEPSPDRAPYTQPLPRSAMPRGPASRSATETSTMPRGTAPPIPA